MGVSGDNFKNLPEGSVDTMHCSLLISPASDSITEGHQVGQAWLPLGPCVLTTDNLLLHVPDDDNQGDLFHISMDGGATVVCSSPSPPSCPF